MMWGHLFVADVTIALLLSTPCRVSSQVLRADSGRREQRNSGQPPIAQQERLLSALDWLDRELSLTDAQTMTVRRILLEEGRQIMSIREDHSLTQDQKRNYVLQLHRSTTYEMTSVLTPDQQENFMKIERHPVVTPTHGELIRNSR
jgi:hypothetical protein